VVCVCVGDEGGGFVRRDSQLGTLPLYLAGRVCGGGVRGKSDCQLEGLTGVLPGRHTIAYQYRRQE